jgi:hypothetical protein
MLSQGFVNDGRHTSLTQAGLAHESLSFAVRSGEGIAGSAALLLFISTFLNWFGTKTVQEPNDLLIYLSLFGPHALNAWQALDFVPLVVLITTTTAVMGFVMRFGGAPRRVLAQTDAAAAILGFVSACLIADQIINPPVIREVAGVARLEGTASTPIYLSLALAAAVVLGALIALRELGFPRARLLSVEPGPLSTTRSQTPRECWHSTLGLSPSRVCGRLVAGTEVTATDERKHPLSKCGRCRFAPEATSPAGSPRDDSQVVISAVGRESVAARCNPLEADAVAWTQREARVDGIVLSPAQAAGPNLT